jgi:hypothetical protein
MAKKFKRIFRETSPEDRARHAVIREEAMREFPPVSPDARKGRLKRSGIGDIKSTTENES